MNAIPLLWPAHWAHGPLLGAALLLGAMPAAQAGANSLNLFTQAEGLHALGIATLAQVSGYPQSQLHTWLTSGGYALWSGGKLRAWHYDTATRTLYFAAERYDTEHTDSNAYRLYRNTANARRMTVVRGPGPQAGTPGAFPEKVVLEQDNAYAPWALLEPDGRYWFWDYIFAGTPKTQLELPLDLPDPSTLSCGVQPRLRVHLRGSSNLSEQSDHQVLGVLNSGPQARVSFDAFAARVLQINFASSALKATGNSLKLTSELPTGVDQAMQRLDRFEVDYCRQTRARDGQLWVHKPAAGVVTVTGLPGPQIAVIQDPAGTGAIWRQNLSVALDGAGGYQVSFEAQGGIDYLVADLGAAQAPELVVDDPSNLTSTANQADYLIIAPKAEMQAAAEALAVHRRAQGLSVMIVWLQDIFDHFSSRRVDPNAIGSFLKKTLAWAGPPDTVVFLGGGTLNHKGRPTFFPGESLIPVKMASGPWGLFPSDNRHCDTTGDGVPEFACGRIPAETAEEALAYIEKLKGFEAAGIGPWMDSAIGIADNADPAAGDFPADASASEQALTGLFTTVTPLHYEQGTAIAPFREALFSAWNSGAALVGYWGHGSTDRWGDEDFLRLDDPSSTSDIAGLTNAPHLPVVAALTCYSGNDAFPGYTALASALVVNPAGGAIATLMPMGMSLHPSAVTLGDQFFAALAGDRKPVGQAAQEAKASAAQAGVPAWELDLFDVTGEPLVQLR